MLSVRKILQSASLLFASSSLAAAAPLLTGVYNAASWVPAGLPNSSIAEGSIFTLIGTGMGPGDLVKVSSYPLPTSQGLAGTSIQVTVAGVTNACIMVYTFATQVAAILPSSTPVGAGTLTLTYQGAQGSIPITVVKNSLGIFAVNEEGSGPGVITNLSYQVQVPTNAAHPGDNLVLWGTGLGPVTGDETEPPVPVDLGTGVQIFVGGQPANVLYGGRGSSPGLDQINFTVPGGLNGCYVSVVAQVNGVVSNFTTIPIAAPGQTYCSDGSAGLSAANLAKLQNELAQQLVNEIKRGEVAIRVGREGLVVSLREVGFFDSGSADVKIKSEPSIERITQVLERGLYLVRIEGHTDNVPIHTERFASNWELSTSRATEMAKLFITRFGFPPDRLSAAGYAEFHPVAPNDTAEGRALNRRVDLVVVAPPTKAQSRLTGGEADGPSRPDVFKQ